MTQTLGIFTSVGLMAIAIGGCGEEDGLWTEFYESGNTKEEYQYYVHPENENRIRHGWYKSYSSDGGYLAIGGYKEDLLDGPWTWYYRSGQLEEKGTYREGQKIGKWVKYYDNGQPKEEGDFVNGERDGEWVWHYENGQLKERGHFKSGKRDGALVSYYEDGAKRHQANFADGVEVAND